MKGKRFLLVMVSLLLVVGLIWSVAGCAAPAAPGQATTVTKTVTATPEKAKREWTVEELGPVDTSWYGSLKGKKVLYSSMFLGWAGTQTWIDGFNQGIEALGGGIELKIYDCEYNLEKEIMGADLAITQAVDIVILCPMDLVGSGTTIKALHEAGIPVINLNMQTAYHADFAVAASMYDGATLATEWICKQLNYEGNIGMIGADRVASSSVSRNQAFYDVAAKYPGIKVVADEVTGSWAAEPTYDVATAVVKSHPEIQGIYFSCDTLAMGGVPALKASNRMDIVTCGNDGTKDGLKMIQVGDLGATIFYDLEEQGRLAMDMCSYILTSKPPYVAGTMAGMRWSEQTVVTIENVNQIPWPKYPLD